MAVKDAVLLSLSILLCLLVVIRFIRDSIQMYEATKRFELSHYMNLLTREGMLYFLAYVLTFSPQSFPFPCHHANGE